MKLSALVLSLLFSLGVCAQATNAVPVFAVGTAQDEQAKVAFAAFAKSGLSSAQEKVLTELETLLKNDFAFYKHRFEAVVISTPVSAASWDAWSGLGFQYVVGLRAKGAGAGVELTAEVWNVTQKKSVGTSTVKAAGTSVRDQGHKFANDIYKMMTGKNGIFQAKIVFVSDRSSFGKDTRKELYAMDFDGRRVERLTFFNSTVISPSVAPDNSRAIFSVIQDRSSMGNRRQIQTKNIDLREYDFATKKFRTVSNNPGVNSGAVYSADGKSIYFTMTTSGNADIYEMSLSGGKPRKITSHYAEDVDPTVTADGSYMSFLSNRPGRAHIYVADPRGTEKDVRRISFVGQFNATPRFSPDGKEIVFTSWVDNNFDLYKIDAQGSNLVRLTKDFGSNEEPWWSPDGEFIIFTSQRVLNRREALQDIYIMNREGEVLGQLTQGFGRCFSPRWSN